MKLSQLIDELLAIEIEHGDMDVRATNDGYAPEDLYICRHKDHDRLVLCGGRPTSPWNMEILNEDR